MTATSDGPVVGTVLFTDLVGFTEYTEAQGDAAALALLDRQGELIEEAVGGGEARLVKELGDGALVWFGVAAHGLAASAGLARSLEDARLRRVIPLPVRMGLHHGPVTERRDDLIGHTVNVASRIGAIAGPGELLVSDAVVAAVAAIPDSIRLDPVGPVPLRGVEAPIWLHRVSSR